jgi:hypothetical protein
VKDHHPLHDRLHLEEEQFQFLENEQTAQVILSWFIKNQFINRPNILAIV